MTMKRHLSLAVAAFLAAAWFSPGPSVEANGQLDRILANMQEAGKGVKTLLANLAFVKRNTDIGGIQDRNSGIIKFRHAGANRDQVRIQYNNGVAVVIDASWIYLYQPSISQLTKTNRRSLATDNRELSFLETPYQSITQLKARYSITHRGDESLHSRPTSVVELTPKAASNTRKLTLWIDHSYWLPIQYEITERASKTTFTLSDLKVNVDLGKDPFKLALPRGTKEVIAK
jgi:outer membrane lipoprotein-sorting protein